MLLGTNPAPPSPAPSFDALAEVWARSPVPLPLAASFSLADVCLDVETNDSRLLSELSETFGVPGAGALSQADGSFEAPLGLHASVRLSGAAGMGHLRLAITGPGDSDLAGPEDLLLGLASPESPFEPFPASEPDWTAFALKGAREPLFAFRGDEALFALTPTGRMGVVLLLFHRLMRLRPDVVFFHAASLSVHGRGVLLVGPKGAGKSTTSLALAARGHGFLGDETAAYASERGELLPMRRPVGVKPGPRARAISAGLTRAGHDPDREGLLRVALETLIPVQATGPVPLGHVLFLEGFREAPSLSPIEPGRDEIARLQPSVSSLVNASPARRVFEMARMLSRARVYRLWPGDPDQTAVLLENALGNA